MSRRMRIGALLLGRMGSRSYEVGTRRDVGRGCWLSQAGEVLSILYVLKFFNDVDMP